MLRIGVDVGGTFTDFVISDGAGTYRVDKVPSTPDNPARAIFQRFDLPDLAAADMRMFSHGTTVTTNAVIQKRTVKVGCLATKGFTDILLFRRTNRGDLYDIQWDPPEPLVPRRLCLGIDERIDHSGAVLAAIDPAEVVEAGRQLVEEGCEAVAIAFLNSYANPANELAARDVLKAAFPDLEVTPSSEILPEWREFERTSTAVINSSTAPLLRRYLEDLREQLGRRGYDGEVFVMLSSGGLSTSKVAAQVSAQTLASGPAAGVIAQRHIGRLIGMNNLVGVDMGGTSTDTALILDGEQRVTPHQEVEFGAVVSLPAVDIKSIGSGGGSIARVDAAGGLSVGPESAGAHPGPVCYGLGGTEPTVTDANLVLGRLSERGLLDGRLTLDRTLAEKAINEKIAEPLGLSVVEAAAGIVRIAVHSMVNAVRLITVEKGLDPRAFGVFGYGGAGPMHVAAIARELEMGTVVVPSHPGNTSALGLLMADIRHDFTQTVLQHSSRLDYDELERVFDAMERRARERLAEEGIAPESMEILRSADLRYSGQTHDLTVPVPDGCVDADAIAEVRKRFDEGHAREFWHAEAPEHPIEVVNLRVTGYGRLEGFELPRRQDPEDASRTPVGHRDVFFDGHGFLSTPVFEKDNLPTGADIAGPAVIEQLDSTTIVEPDQVFGVDGYDNLIIRVGA